MVCLARWVDEVRGNVSVSHPGSSSLERFAPTREFYRKHGYDQEARIREFYGPGDHKVVFWKMLNPAV